MIRDYTRSILSVLMALVAFVLVGCGSEEAATVDESSSVQAATVRTVSSGKEKLQKLNIDLSKAKDGVWTAESNSHDKFGKSKVELTIKDHKITDVVFTGYTPEGTRKDSDYGSEKGDELAYKAQQVVKAMDLYEKQLLDMQDPFRVDTVSGATVSGAQFREASGKAIQKAIQE